MSIYFNIVLTSIQFKTTTCNIDLLPLIDIKNVIRNKCV